MLKASHDKHTHRKSFYKKNCQNKTRKIVAWHGKKNNKIKSDWIYAPAATI